MYYEDCGNKRIVVVCIVAEHLENETFDNNRTHPYCKDLGHHPISSLCHSIIGEVNLWHRLEREAR